jgi:amino acid permease
MRGSILNLVASSIGSSTLTIPYLMALNGIFGGVFWVTFGAIWTYYSGRLLVSSFL